MSVAHHINIAICSAERAAGQLLIAGFDGISYTPALGLFCKRTKPGGLVLFSRNLQNRKQARRLIDDLKKLGEDTTDLPFFICIDQEGGRVARLPKDMPTFPTPRSLGINGSAEQVEDVHATIGATLAGIGVNVDFAPVLDLLSNPDSPVIGDRSFSSDPEQVARLGKAAIRGLRRGGVLACGKHFPGHGDTNIDSHFALPTDPRPRNRLREMEMEPFRMAVEERVDFIMTAHVVYPNLDAKNPATFSKSIITGMLRDEIGYDGVIIGDDFDMAAVAARYSDEEAVEQGLMAGLDMMLVCHEGARRTNVFEATRNMIDSGVLDENETKLRIERIMKAKNRMAEQQPDA